MLQNIVLHGQLKRDFGGPFKLDVSTPAEAVLALTVLKPGFAEAIRAGHWRVVRGPLAGGRRLSADDLQINLGGEMHLLAAPRGSGRSGGSTAKVVIGTALIAAAFVLAPPVGAAGAAAATGGGVGAGMAGAAFGSTFMAGLGISGTQVALFGLSMALGGVSQLLSPQPKANSGFSPQDVRASHLFSGALNSPDQGVPVPLAFGETRCGGVLVSMSLETEDIAV